MHGLVFVAIEHHLRVNHEEALREACFPTPGTYLPISDYPDEDLLRIARLAAATMSSTAPRPLDEILSRFGQAVPSMVQRLAPTSLPRAAGFADLVTQIERNVQGLVRSLLPPLTVERRPDGLPALIYTGESRLCRFAEGLLIGLSAVLGEAVAFRHPTCRARGEDRCVFLPRLVRSETTSLATPPVATKG